ncbi:MAG: 1-hydroxycarotenoid 3,4-desaturase CrtD [Pseudomonadota bacterium]
MGQSVAIIGAGIGGLTSAALLAARGFDVNVFEKEAWVGGKARRVDVDGQPVDAGPTVFTLRDVFETIFHTCGARLGDCIKVRQAEVIARHAWSEDERLDLFADPIRSEQAIGDFAGADAAAGYRAFRAEARRIFEVLDQPFLRGKSASSPLPMMWRMGIWRIDAMLAMRPFDNYWKALGKHFPDPRLQQLFGRYATYCGSSPYHAPATLMLIAHTEARGVWLIEGGIHALAKALRELAERNGARIRTDAPVAKVLFRHNRACGLQLASGEEIAADAVLCNADPSALGEGRFGEAAQAAVRPLPPGKRSLSALVWYAHAKTSGFELQHHNVFFSPDYAQEFREIAAGQPPSDPTAYVCALDRGASTSRHRVSYLAQARERERLQVIVNAPANGDTRTYPEEEMERCTTAMRSTLERCGLILEDPMPYFLATPQTWEKLFPASGGALYGRASHGWAASFQRQGPRTRIKGLYCAGGATHPSAGVPMAALSGMLAADTIQSDHASMRRSYPAHIPGGTSMRSATTGSTG